MAKRKTSLDRAIDSIEQEIRVLQAALDRLRAQHQAQPVRRKRGSTPTAAAAEK